MLNRIVWIVFISLILLSFLGAFSAWFDESNWNPFDYARITAVDYKAVVVDEPDSYGKVIITEILTFDIHAASYGNRFWELWRDLPEEYVDGVKVDYNVLSVRQVFNDGREPVLFKEAPKLYWWDSDFTDSAGGLGPGKWYHSRGPYDGERNFECVLFYVDGLYRETVYFEVQYEMLNASLRYGDCSELYISLYSGDTVKFLRDFKAQFLFPSDIMPREENYKAFTFGTNSHGFPFSESAAINPGYFTFSFELDESSLRFRPYNQYIEFALIAFGDDRHIFTEHASVNRYFLADVLDNLLHEQEKYEGLPGRFRVAKIVVLTLCSAVVILLILHTLGIDKRMRRKHIFYKPSMDIKYFRDIPSELDPNFAAALVFSKHKKSDDVKDGYSAVMLDLVRKGYIEIERVNPSIGWDSHNTRIVVKFKPDVPTSFCADCGTPAKPYDQYCSRCGSQVNIGIDTQKPKPLTKTEELYFNLILKHSGVNGISLASFKQSVSNDYEYTDYFVRAIRHAITSIGLAEGYLQKFEYKKPAQAVRSSSIGLYIVGILILVVANLISYGTRFYLAYGSFFILGFGFIACAVYLTVVSKKFVLLTQFGENEYAKWRGLYDFLNSETLMKERTVIDLVIWEQYLVYATAFGISDKVIKALQIRCTESVLSSSPVLRNPYYRTRVFYSSGRSFRTATRTASFTYRSGSHGGGGGFGSSYGGGGRGGGGGGGGH